MTKVRGFNEMQPYTDESQIPMLCEVQDMCKFFKCSEQMVRKKCEAGQIPGAFTKGRRWYCHKRDLLNWGKEA